MTYDDPVVDKDTLIQALHSKLREDMESPENVQYNEGIIDAIEVVEKLAALYKPKQTS
jgi:predicted house-cleaning noncanonical NTP pyrophosphatase (MazG superfamily)